MASFVISFAGFSSGSFQITLLLFSLNMYVFAFYTYLAIRKQELFFQLGIGYQYTAITLSKKRLLTCDKVIYSVKHDTYIVINTRWFKYDRNWCRQIYTHFSPGHIWTTLCIVGNSFNSSEPSSDQHLIHGHSAFSECAHYGIPYCSETIFILKCRLKIYGRCIFKIYVKTPISKLVNPY